MASTFGYSNGNILIKNKLNSDFLSHISLIRSFSRGENFPPEYPHFAGVPIRYHFIFYAAVGLLEMAGMRIDFALNSLSIIGFAGLLIIVFLLAKKITKSNFVGLGAILTIVFNPALSWIYYFFIGKNHLTNFLELLSTKNFGSFGPYDDNIISAFWNLNIYTNQRHLAFSFLLMFIALWIIIYSKGKKKLIIAILIIGLMSWMHKAVLLMIFFNLGVFFFAFPKKRKRILFGIFAGILLAIPGLLYLSSSNIDMTSANPDNRLFVWVPGFLYKSTTWWEMKPASDLEQWIIYWFLNIGILPILTFAGAILVILSNRVKDTGNFLNKLWLTFVNPKTAWFLSATVIFIIANLFKFGLDMANNHKLINFSVMIWGIYAYIFIKSVWDNLKIFGKVIAQILIFCLIFGGICDLFPIYNDGVGEINDVEKSNNAQWVANNSKPKDVFLDMNAEFHSVILNGRKLYLGVAYFNWSLGYPVDERTNKILKLQTDNFPKDDWCNFLQQENIAFFYLNINDHKLFDRDFDTQAFIDKFSNETKLEYGIYMYKTVDTCAN